MSEFFMDLEPSCDAIYVEVAPGSRYKIECPCTEDGEWGTNTWVRLIYCNGNPGVTLESERGDGPAQYWLVVDEDAPGVRNFEIEYRYARLDDEGMNDLLWDYIYLTIVDETLHPNVTMSANDDYISPGETVIITASAEGGTSPYTFEWSASPPDESLSPDEAGFAQIEVAPLVPTTYTVRVTDAENYVDIDSLHIHVGLFVQASADPNTIWDGQSTQLSAIADGGVGPITYQWSPLYYLSNHEIANPIATIHNTKTFVVRVADSLLNVAMDSVTVTVHMRHIGLAATTINLGESVTLYLTVYGGREPYTYDWSPTETLNDPSLPEPIATPTATTTYTVVVTDADGQSLTAESRVNVIGGGEPVFACFEMEPMIAEAGTEVYFDAQCSMGDITEYRWWWHYEIEEMNALDGEPDLITTSPFASHVFETPGNYYVRLHVTDGQGHEDATIDYLIVE